MKKISQILCFFVTLCLLSSCAQIPQDYVQEGNQIYTLPGKTILVNIKLDIQSLNGEWASEIFPEFTGRSIQTTPTVGEVNIVGAEIPTTAPTVVPPETGNMEWDVKCSNDCLQLILTNPDTPTVISYVVKKEHKWEDRIGSEMENIIIPVEITIPDDVVVPSMWSGYLVGKVIIAESIAGGKYGTNEKDVNALVILQIITPEELESMKK